MRIDRFKAPPEPIVNGKIFEHNTEYTSVLNWYCLMTMEQAKEYLLVWAIKNDKENYPRLSKVPLKWINQTAAKIARIIMRGGTPPESSIIFLDKQIKEMLKKANTEEDPEKELPKVSVQEHVKAKAGNLVAELEGMIDDGNHNFNAFILEQKISGVVAAKLVLHFTPILDELVAVTTPGCDQVLLEGYKFNNRKDVIKARDTYKLLIETLEKHSDNKRKSRAPRKRKPLTAEKLLKHFKYRAAHTELQLASIHPERIIGANELWTYNVNNKVLTVYRAIDRGGLSINRTYITKYDEKQSVAKRIGRKAEETIKTVLDGGKVTLRKLMDGIKSDPLPVSRINMATILLRVG